RGYKEKETDLEEARKRYWAGGTKYGMVGTGAIIGTAIAPGIGTAIGAGIGGIVSLLGGEAISETLRNAWDGFLSRGREAWDTVATWASEAWENTKESLSSTLFSSEWWQEKWDNVKSWTSGKWNEMKTVWETAKEAISSTLFSKDWWGSKWESVKSWAGNSLSGIGAWWENLKTSFATGREAGQRVAVAKYAVGGILTRPHLGLVAEAGPEAIIPLSVSMRSRA